MLTIVDRSVPFPAIPRQCPPPSEAQHRARGVATLHRNLHTNWSNFDHPLDPFLQPSCPSADPLAHCQLAKRVFNNRTLAPANLGRHTRAPNAPARCAVAVSVVTTRSRFRV